MSTQDLEAVQQIVSDLRKQKEVLEQLKAPNDYSTEQDEYRLNEASLHIMRSIEELLDVSVTPKKSN